jgi:hypothetical protein
MDRTAIELIMNLRYGISIGPKNECDAFLIKISLIVAALHLQTHNQILSRAVGSERNHIYIQLNLLE